MKRLICRLFGHDWDYCWVRMRRDRRMFDSMRCRRCKLVHEQAGGAFWPPTMRQQP